MCLQLCQALAKSIAWDGEGATVLIEVQVTGARSEAEAATVAKSVVGSSLTKVGLRQSSNCPLLTARDLQV